MLQEARKPSLSRQCFRTSWGRRNRDRIVTPSLGSAGVMLIAWKTDLFELEADEMVPTHYQLHSWIVLRDSRGGSLVSFKIVEKKNFGWN